MSYKIDIYESIGNFEDMFSVKKLQEHLKNANGQELEIYINSCGGMVMEGLAIYNILKRYPNKKTVYIDGIAASIASVIAMCGDNILMPRNALMLIHSVHTENQEDNSENEAIRKLNDSIKSIYLERSKMSESELDEILRSRADVFFNAEECFELGLCDEIIEQNIEYVASINLENYKANKLDRFTIWNGLVFKKEEYEKRKAILDNLNLDKFENKINIGTKGANEMSNYDDFGKLFIEHTRLSKITNMGIEKFNLSHEKLLPTKLQKEIISIASNAPMKNILNLITLTYENGIYEVPVLGFDSTGELSIIDAIEYDMSKGRDRQLIKELPEYLSTVLAEDLFDAIKIYLASRAVMKIEADIQNILDTKSKIIKGKYADIRSLILEAYNSFDRRMKDNLSIVLDYPTYLKLKEILKEDISETSFLKINYYIDNSILGFYLLDAKKIHTNIHKQITDLDKNVENGKYTSAITTWSNTELTLTDEVIGIVKIDFEEVK